MARQLQRLQPVAWKLKELPDDVSSVSVLKLPTLYQQTLSDLVTLKNDVPPIASLHDTLAASSHSIIAFAPQVYRLMESYPEWMYVAGDSSVNTRKLRLLFNKWLQAIGHADKQVVQTQDSLHFIWDQIDLNAAGDPLRRMLLPNRIARWLVEQGFELRLSGSTYPLRLVPLMSTRYAAELITEPIRFHDDLFSFVVRFWMMPLAGEAAPVLLHKTSVRRWARDEVTIYYRQGKSLYLRRAAGYLDDAPRRDVFTRVTVKSFGRDRLGYLGKQADLLDLLPLEGELPPVEAFLMNPTAFEDQALMPLRSRDAYNMDVQAGLESNDHRELFESLCSAMVPFATPLPVLKRAHKGKRTRGSAQITPEDRRAALLNIQEPLNIHIHSDTHFTEMTRAVLKAVGFEDTVTPTTPVQIKDADGRVCLHIEPLEDRSLTDELSADYARQPKTDYIRDKYSPTDQPTGLLVELRDFRKTKLQKRDPKQAIVQGMLQTRRIVQTLVPHDASPEDYQHRCQNAAADLLRMLGYRPRPFFTSEPTRDLPERLDLLAFWVFQLNKRHRAERTSYLPVVVDVPYGYPHLRVTLPSASGRSETYPSLYAGIMAATSGITDFNDTNRAINFFQAVLEERERTDPALLLLDDANLRRCFDELNDPNHNPLSLYGILDEAPHVRVARLRYSEDGEAPFCVPPEPKSKYQGMYTATDVPGLFYSLHNVGNRRIRANQRKIDDPTNASVNPSTVLIQMCNLQPLDDVEEWAGVVHRLRTASTHTDIATQRPQPLHDITAMKKYIPRYRDMYEDEDLNAVDEKVE